MASLDHEALQSVEATGNYAAIPDIHPECARPCMFAASRHLYGVRECCRKRRLVGVGHTTMTLTTRGVAELKAGL